MPPPVPEPPPRRSPSRTQNSAADPGRTPNGGWAGSAAEFPLKPLWQAARGWTGDPRFHPPRSSSNASDAEVTVPNVTDDRQPATDSKSLARRLAQSALDGVVGNATWGLFALGVVVAGAFVHGTVPAWLFAAVVVVAFAVPAFIGSASNGQMERMRGALDEARRHESEATRRAVEIEEKAEAEKRELREQLAAVSGGQQAVSTRMQSIARQAEALSSTSIGDYGPTDTQADLLVALVEDLERIAPGGDPVVTRLLAAWRNSSQSHSTAEWNSALGLLKARAISIGAEEALGQQP